MANSSYHIAYVQGPPGDCFAVLLLVNTHALLSTDATPHHPRVVLGNSSSKGGEETAMLVEERSCAMQVVDAARLMHLPALEVEAVRIYTSGLMNTPSDEHTSGC